MNKFFKILLITALNILFIIIIFFIIEFLCYKKAVNTCIDYFHFSDYSPKFSYRTILPKELKSIKNFFDGKDSIEYSGRLPDGTEYKNKPGIVVFGCSFAFGYGLKYNQTFSYKLAHLMKRPVYNRAYPSWGPQHMYYQTLTDSFYEQTKNADTYIFIMISDHARRTQLEHFFISEDQAYLHYNLRKNKFIMNNYNSKLSNFFRALYIRKLFKYYKAQEHYYKNNKKETERVTEYVYEYLLQSRNNIENRLGKKINFIVIYFENNDNYVIPGKDIITRILKENGFIVFSIKDLTNKKIDTDEYNLENGHPNEKTWDLLTPLIAKKIETIN